MNGLVHEILKGIEVLPPFSYQQAITVSGDRYDDGIGFFLHFYPGRDVHPRQNALDKLLSPESFNMSGRRRPRIFFALILPDGPVWFSMMTFLGRVSPRNSAVAAPCGRAGSFFFYGRLFFKGRGWRLHLMESMIRQKPGLIISVDQMVKFLVNLQYAGPDMGLFGAEAQKTCVAFRKDFDIQFVARRLKLPACFGDCIVYCFGFNIDGFHVCIDFSVYSKVRLAEISLRQFFVDIDLLADTDDVVEKPVNHQSRRKI